MNMEMLTCISHSSEGMTSRLDPKILLITVTGKVHLHMFDLNVNFNLVIRDLCYLFNGNTSFTV